MNYQKVLSTWLAILSLRGQRVRRSWQSSTRHRFEYLRSEIEADAAVSRICFVAYGRALVHVYADGFLRERTLSRQSNGHCAFQFMRISYFFSEACQRSSLTPESTLSRYAGSTSHRTQYGASEF